MDEFDDKQQKNNTKPDDVIEPSIVEDLSFSSFLKPYINNNNNNTEECDQISIFDAAKYLSGLHDNLLQNQRDRELNVVSPIPPRLSSVSSSVETTSSYGARNSQSSDRTRSSFRSTPTASSEASWNSQAGLLVNPPGSSVGINIINKSLTTTTNSSKWARISTKWLNRGSSKCPCYGKKAVQVVEERIVHLRKITSSNSIHQTIIENNNDESIGITGGRTSSGNGFTFPILFENNEPILGFKKMFNITSHQAGNEDALHRESLESSFQPKCLQNSKSRRASYEDENVSDGSSDLFEIESFSTMTYPCRRDSNSIDEVIVPSYLNNIGGTSMTKLGIICSPYSNQDTNEDEDHNIINSNSNSNVDGSDYVDVESETTSATPDGCYAPPAGEVSIDWSTVTSIGNSIQCHNS